MHYSLHPFRCIPADCKPSLIVWGPESLCPPNDHVIREGSTGVETGVHSIFWPR